MKIFYLNRTEDESGISGTGRDLVRVGSGQDEVSHEIQPQDLDRRMDDTCW